MSELELLRRGFEAVPRPDEATIQHARVRLLDQIESSGAPPPRRRLRAVANRRLAFALPVMAALALAGVLSLHGRFAAVDPADAAARVCKGPWPAGACLQALAAVARAQAPRSPVVYRRVQDLRRHPFSSGGHHFMVVGVITVESWLDRRQRSAVQRTKIQLRFPTRRDRLAWLRAGSPSVDAMFGTRLADTGVRVVPNADVLFFYDLRAWQRATGSQQPGAAIPTDPVRALQLLNRVWRISGRHGPVGALADMPLQDPRLRPAQRAALFSALALTAAARRLPLRDPLGRAGVAVIGPSGYPGFQWVTVFDVRTSRVLAEGVQGRKIVGVPTPPPHRVWMRVFPPTPRITPGRPSLSR